MHQSFFKRNKIKNAGFTLVELLVAVGLFSVVITIAIGSIFTIIDSNKKSQSLTIVMNDLNFALEDMTRTIKTASVINAMSFSSSSDILSFTDSRGNLIKYKLDDKKIMKSYDGGDFKPVTSDSIEIEYFDVLITNPGTDDGQPKVFIKLQGVAEISPRIKSDFNIQTTITPRNLEI